MISLEPTTNQHLPYLLDMLRQPGVSEMLFWDTGRLSLESLPATLIKAAPDTASVAFSVIHQEALAGVVTINDIHPVHRSATVGMLAIQPGLRDRGRVGYYAGQETVKYGFESLNLNRIDCRIMAHNQPIQKLVRRVGMIEEGTVRDALYKDGRYVDIKLFSLLKGDWDATRRT